MKKTSRLSTISSIAVLAFIVPQIAFAAWWNPANWFNGWSFFHRVDTKTQVLETRIQELEAKLASSTSTTTTAPVFNTEAKKVVPVKAAAPTNLAPATEKASAVAPVSSQTTNSTALSDYAKCLEGVTTFIEQLREKNREKEQQCLADNEGNWQAPILCSYSINTQLYYSVCTGSYNPYPAPVTPAPITSGPSAFDEIQAHIEQQRQTTFQRETCERLGGGYVGGRCSY